MAHFNGAVVTKAGMDLALGAAAGVQNIEFVKMVSGNGEYTEEEKIKDALRERSGLKNQMQEFPFNSVEITSENTAVLKSIITNKSLTDGYRITEIGVYARVKGTEGDGVLYSIALAIEADYLPPYINPTEIIQEYYITVSDTAEISIVSNPGAYALAEDLEKLRKDVENTGLLEPAGGGNDGPGGDGSEGNDTFIGKMKDFMNRVKAAAFATIVNHCLTTEPGTVLDGRVGKILMDEITKNQEASTDAIKELQDANNAINSNISFPDGEGFFPDVQDGIRGYNTDAARGADTFHPFSNVLHTTTFKYYFSKGSGKRIMNISPYLPSGAVAIGIKGITVGTYGLTYEIEPGNILSINGSNSGDASANVTIIYK